MRTLLSCLLLSFYAASGLAQGIGGGGVQPPALEDAILTAGLSTVGSDGRNWAYVTWRSPGETTLTGKTFAVYLQAVPGGPFTQQAIVSPTSDVPAMQLLLSRAAKLGVSSAALNTDLRDLLRKKGWAGNVGAHGFATNTSPLDNKPVEQKLSAVLGKALQSADAMRTVQTLAHVHPALRMALGRAWAGALPVGAGPMVIELREWTGGADGGVVGRVQLTPGQGETLAAPGRVVQVPHLKPKSDLTIRLRWVVPDALRRQQLQALGFTVFRVEKNFAQANGLPLDATPAQVEQFVTLHGAAHVVQVNDAPVPITKLYNDGDVEVFDFNGADPATHLLADDANRDQPVTEGNLNVRYPGFTHGSRWRYFVRAVDLLGRAGPPSPVGEGIALRTLPPDVPQGLTVTDLPVGPDGQRRQVLRWRANGTPLGVPNRNATAYAIYRGYGPEDWQGTNLNSLEVPFMFSNLEPIGTVASNQLDENGMLTFTDNNSAPTPGNLDRSVWYAVTAIHETPLDGYFSNLHDRVESAPSAPAFGIFRDREGPAPPVGVINVNCGKLVTQFRGNATAPRTSAVTNGKQVHVRARCTRRRGDVAAVQFGFFSGRGLTAVPLHFSPLIPFVDNVAVYEQSFLEVQTNALNVSCVAYSPDGCVSIISDSNVASLTASETLWVVRNFTAGNYAASDFVPGGAVGELGTEVTFQSQQMIGPDTRRGNLAAGLNGRTLVVEEFINDGQVPAFWELRAAAQVRGDAVLFPWKATRLLPGQTPSFRATLLPEGGDCECLHEARPPSQDKTVPVTVATNVPATTKEWRLYRRVDEGDFALVKSLAMDPAEQLPEQIMAEDTSLPPYGGTVAYYAQCFDANHNPSALVYLGSVQLLPTLATPVLNVPEMLSMENDRGRVLLKWFCPRAGVKRFRVDLTPLNAGDPGALPVSALTQTDISLPVQGVLIPSSYKLPGEAVWKTMQVLRYFHTEELSTESAVSTFNATLSVTPGVPYVAWVTAEGEQGVMWQASTARLLTWQAPPVNQVESLVAWPARPLPEVVTHPDIEARLSADLLALNGFQPNQSTVFDAGSAALYPVNISIGLLSVGIWSQTHSAGDPMAAVYPTEFTIDVPNLAAQGLEVSPLSKGTDPAKYLYPDVLPCVLYRQTVLANNKGALVQVSPLRMGVAHQVTNRVVGHDTYTTTTIRDPFIKVFTREVGGNMVSLITLVDTHAVEEGATYRYYLVNYRADGEIHKVYDCGAVTIPETP